MDIKRTVLWVIFFMSAVMLYDNWQRDHGRPSMFFPSAVPTKTVGSAAPGTTTPGTQAADLPSTPGVPGAPAAPGSNAPASSAADQLVNFSTDVYSGQIDTRGGTLSKLSLVKEGDGKQPDLYITLFDHTATHTYLARTGLLGGDFPNHNDVFTLVPGSQTSMDGGNTLSIAFESPVKGGVKVIKTYTFTRGSYVIGVDTKVQNVGTAPVTPRLYMELVRDDSPVETPRFSHTFIGPAVYTEQHHFQKMTFSDIDKGKEDFAPSADNGWVAMVQHYFASAWIPQQGVKRDIYVQKIDPALYRVGVQQPLQTIAPGQTVDVQARLFAGPEEERMLEGIAPGLELVKDYGMVTIIAKPLFWLLGRSIAMWATGAGRSSCSRC